ncbi:MAG: hypothetical protein GX850_04925 [Clostridiaceae bacterium]|jgi:hypothetical protein|nr:hypothetical protein [Clostridiaceae bacterium]
MNMYEDGNLARQFARPASYALPQVDAPHPDEREAKKKARRETLRSEAAIREQYKIASRNRTRAAFRLFTVFIALTVAVGFVVWRSAKITEMSFVNAGLSRQISEFEKHNSLLQDRISAKSSLQVVRDNATNRLGMQKAASDQILLVPAAILRAGSDQDLLLEHNSPGKRFVNENVELIESWVRLR